MTAQRITLDQARRAWVAQQHLEGVKSRAGTLAEAVGDFGWIAMSSSIAPYLALFARGLIAHRTDLDARVGDFAIVPGPKGSTWFVPVADAPMARAFAVADHATREARIAATTTLPARELTATRELLRSELSQPVTLAALRAKLPDSALRSLGTPGRKAGMPTLASMMLRAMWVEGEVHRVMPGRRLDAGETTWAIDPRPRVVPPAADAVAQVAARWIASHGPVSARAFASAFGTPTGRAMPAIRATHPSEITIEGSDEEFLARPGFETPSAPRGAPTARLLGARDPLTEVHLAMLTTEEGARVATSKSGASMPVAIANDRVVATWMFDPLTRDVVLTPIDPTDDDGLALARIEAQRLRAFLAEEIDPSALRVGPAPSGRSRTGTLAPLDLVVELP